MQSQEAHGKVTTGRSNLSTGTSSFFESCVKVTKVGYPPLFLPNLAAYSISVLIIYTFITALKHICTTSRVAE